MSLYNRKRNVPRKIFSIDPLRNFSWKFGRKQKYNIGYSIFSLKIMNNGLFDIFILGIVTMVERTDDALGVFNTLSLYVL
jgi:hypothetical protein